MRNLKVSLLVGVVSLAAACGGGDGAKEGTTNPANAKTSVTQASTVNSQMGMSDSGGVSGAINAMTSANQGIVTGGAGRESELLGLIPSTLPKINTESATGTATCTPTGCTFMQYGDVGYSIDGSVNKSGDTLTFDLTEDFTTQMLHFQIDGSLTVTATSIDGEVHSKGNTSGSASGGYNVDWDIDVEYNAVQINAAGCPTSGSVHATSKYDVSAGGQSANGYNVQGTVTFDGTGC
ncbi:MAG TPA: hypothetical protein VGM39_26425 [Kofleriaceae bacterium]|jgi:hypothetical protein